MTSEKRSKVSEVLNDAVNIKVKGTKQYVPPKYSDMFPDGGHGWSRPYKDPGKKDVQTTEKGVEEVRNER